MRSIIAKTVVRLVDLSFVSPEIYRECLDRDHSITTGLTLYKSSIGAF